MATSAYSVANLPCSELTNYRGQNFVSAQYAPPINQPISGYYEQVPQSTQPMRCNLENSSDSSKLMTSPIDPQLKVDLHDKELWEKFSSAQTEMIVTKIGRRMFPGYRVKLSGLDPEAQYCVLMDVVNVDDHRYKFQNGEWSIAGRGEPQIPQRFYLHPTSPASGQQWMREIVSFHKVKLTNSCGNSADGKFLIHSMHRYQPRIHVVRTDDVSTLHLQPMSIFSFPQTSFITVTAYQNHEVTKLKVDNNPFARGFRTNGGKTKKSKLACVQDTRSHNFNSKREVETLENEKFNKRPRADSITSETNVYANQQLGYPTQPSSYFAAPTSSSGYQFTQFQPSSTQYQMPFADCGYNNPTAQDIYQTYQVPLTNQTVADLYTSTQPTAEANSPMLSPNSDVISPVSHCSFFGQNLSPNAYDATTLPPSTDSLQRSAQRFTYIHGDANQGELWNACENSVFHNSFTPAYYGSEISNFRTPLTSADDGYTSLNDDVIIASPELNHVTSSTPANDIYVNGGHYHQSSVY